MGGGEVEWAVLTELNREQAGKFKPRCVVVHLQHEVGGRGREREREGERERGRGKVR